VRARALTLYLLMPFAAVAAVSRTEQDTGQGSSPVLARRAQLQRQASEGAAAVPALAAALQDASPLVRRQAARLLLEMGAPGQAALTATLGNSDLLVRRTALKATWRMPPEQALPHLKTALADENALVRQAAVSRLVVIRPQTRAVAMLLEQAGKDEVEAVRVPALKALWPFHRDNVSIRDRHYDHDVQVAQAIRLPKDGWQFRIDPKRDGHRKGWFKPGLADAQWRPVAIEQPWQKAGVEHTGVAWYRRWIDLPDKPEKLLAAELHFLGVDESAWVWVNGVYIGQHDVGPSGWDQPFRLDATKELKWGTKNHITVRAMNTAHAGGIWRPVELEALR